MSDERTCGASPSDYDPKDDPEAVKPDLLDFLFTLALMVGLAPELLGTKFDGVLSWNWGLQVPSVATAFDAGVFLLGLLTLTFSWYGFNASVHKEPVLYGSISGMIRFVLDAFLIVLYGFMLLMFERFAIIFLTLVVVFFLYAVWDGLKLIEYWKEPGVDVTDENSRRTLGTVGWYLGKLWKQKSLKYFIILTIFFVAYLGNRLFVGVVWLDWAFLAGLIVATTVYRFEKMGFKLRGPRSVVKRIDKHND